MRAPRGNLEGPATHEQECESDNVRRPTAMGRNTAGNPGEQHRVEIVTANVGVGHDSLTADGSL